MITSGGVTVSGRVFSGGKVVGGGNLLQTKSAEVTVDTTTTSTSFVTLMSVPITTKEGTALMVQFAGNFTQSQNSGRIATEIDVDGTQYAAGDVTHDSSGSGAAHALVARVTGLVAGAHTVSINWKVPASTARCRPVTQPDREGANVLVSEVAA